MLTTTYIVTFDAGENGKTEEYVQETKIGFSENDAIDQIILGDCVFPFASVYRVCYDEECRDVTKELAEKIFQYAKKKPISLEAERWLDWCGYDLPNDDDED